MERREKLILSSSSSSRTQTRSMKSRKTRSIHPFSSSNIEKIEIPKPPRPLSRPHRPLRPPRRPPNPCPDFALIPTVDHRQRLDRFLEHCLKINIFWPKKIVQQQSGNTTTISYQLNYLSASLITIPTNPDIDNLN